MEVSKWRKLRFFLQVAKNKLGDDASFDCSAATIGLGFELDMTKCFM